MALQMHLIPPWNLTDEHHPLKRALLLEDMFQTAAEGALLAAQAAGATKIEAVGMLYAQVLRVWGLMSPKDAIETQELAAGFYLIVNGPNEDVA
jgi:hypothetical protein